MQIASMILGIISIVPLSFLGISGPVGFIGTACALAAIVLAAIGLKKNEKKGFCIAGLITGIFGLLISLIITISCTICWGKVKSGIDQAVKSGELDGLTESLKSLGSTLESTDTSSTDWDALGEEFSKNLSDGLKGVVDGVEGGVKNGLNDLGNALKSLGDSLSN